MTRAMRAATARALTTLAALTMLCALTMGTAPPASAAAPAPMRLGYCGGDDWEPAMASDSGHVYVLITHFSGSTSCDPASGQNNSRIMIQVSL